MILSCTGLPRSTCHLEVAGCCWPPVLLFLPLFPGGISCAWSIGSNLTAFMPRLAADSLPTLTLSTGVMLTWNDNCKRKRHVEEFGEARHLKQRSKSERQPLGGKPTWRRGCVIRRCRSLIWTSTLLIDLASIPIKTTEASRHVPGYGLNRGSIIPCNQVNA